MTIHLITAKTTAETPTTIIIRRTVKRGPDIRMGGDSRTQGEFDHNVNMFGNRPVGGQSRRLRRPCDCVAERGEQQVVLS